MFSGFGGFSFRVKLGFGLSLYLFNLEGSKLCGEIVVVVGMLCDCGCCPEWYPPNPPTSY